MFLPVPGLTCTAAAAAGGDPGVVPSAPAGRGDPSGESLAVPRGEPRPPEPRAAAVGEAWPGTEGLRAGRGRGERTSADVTVEEEAHDVCNRRQQRR